MGKGKGKAGIAVHGTPYHSYGVSLAIWDHSVTYHPTIIINHLFNSDHLFNPVYTPVASLSYYTLLLLSLSLLHYFFIVFLKIYLAIRLWAIQPQVCNKLIKLSIQCSYCLLYGLGLRRDWLAATQVSRLSSCRRWPSYLSG